MGLVRKTSSARIETTTIATDVVFDASAILRALVDKDAEAVDWLGRVARQEVRAACPDLLYAEVANAVLIQQRAGRLTLARAKRVLDAALVLPFATERVRSLAIAALIVAIDRDISAYDACYVALAETMGAPLVTADKRLAAATPNGVLLTP